MTNIQYLMTVRNKAALPSLWKQIIILVVGKSSLIHNLSWHLNTEEVCNY